MFFLGATDEMDARHRYSTVDSLKRFAEKRNELKSDVISAIYLRPLIADILNYSFDILRAFL